MELLSLAKNPVPAGAVVGVIRWVRRCAAALCSLGGDEIAASGHDCLFGGRGGVHRKVFRGDRGPAAARLCRRDDGLARPGWFDRALGNKAKGYIGDFSEYDRDLSAS